MSKAFVKETGDDDELSLLPEMPTGVKNYITPAGYRYLQTELSRLLASAREEHNDKRDAERGDAVISTESPERALREIEQTIRYLQARLETAQVVDPSVHAGEEQVFFGATVTYQQEDGAEQTVTIVGLDELDPDHGKISWLSPVAQALLTAYEGDDVVLESPTGSKTLQIVAVNYPSRAGEPDGCSAGRNDNNRG